MKNNRKKKKTKKNNKKNEICTHTHCNHRTLEESSEKVKENGKKHSTSQCLRMNHPFNSMGRFDIIIIFDFAHIN